MRKRFLVLIFISLLFPALIFAQQSQTSPAKAKPKTVLDFKEELGLSSSQVDRLKVIIDNFEKAAQPLRQKIVLQNREIKDLLDKGTDLNVIKPKVKEVFSVRADLVMVELEAVRKINGVLTPDQQTKWKEIRRTGGKKS
ncbi:MAG: Spy/CpxP family protein refolding chaperone [Desulfobacterota bacterium]|nr:Spy/CpxP family protein refolding chaperone [Thermodesulfobacteriota bacterium]